MIFGLVPRPIDSFRERMGKLEDDTLKEFAGEIDRASRLDNPSQKIDAMMKIKGNVTLWDATTREKHYSEGTIREERIGKVIDWMGGIAVLPLRILFVVLQCPILAPVLVLLAIGVTMIAVPILGALSLSLGYLTIRQRLLKQEFKQQARLKIQTPFWHPERFIALDSTKTAARRAVIVTLRDDKSDAKYKRPVRLIQMLLAEEAVNRRSGYSDQESNQLNFFQQVVDKVQEEGIRSPYQILTHNRVSNLLQAKGI